MSKSELHIGKDQLRALTNPLRLEIHTSLRMDGPATARDLAHRLGADEMSLYYHLRLMKKLGLVLTELRPTATKPETIFEVPRKIVVDQIDLNEDENVEEVCRNVDALLRSSSREYRAAVSAHRNGIHDSSEIRRMAIRVTPETKIEFHRKLTELFAWLDNEASPDGDRYSLTMAFIPLISKDSGT